MIRMFKNFLALFTGKPQVAFKQRSQETMNLLLSRRSCREFSDEEIAPDDIQAILEAGRFAPSTVNLQTWSFITFTRAQWREKFERPIPFSGMQAVVICADMYRLKKHFSDLMDTPHVNISFALFNAGLAAMNMTIAAEALGLKSIMLSETGKTGILDYAYLKEHLRLPDDVIPVTTLVIGRAKGEKAGTPPRQPWKAMVMEKIYNADNCEMLEDWQQQMFIGFKLTHPLSNFQKQLEMYKKKMVEAEEELKKQYRV
jgi:FMN reductase (NADPH)